MTDKLTHSRLDAGVVQIDVAYAHAVTLGNLCEIPIAASRGGDGCSANNLEFAIANNA
jgi:hypothetical protein